MSHPLIDSLTTEHGYPAVTLTSHEAFISEPGVSVLFFPGDPTIVREATDVAVVLPELVRAFDGRLRPGVVIDTYGDGKALKHTYGFARFPALVFLRDGKYVGTIEGIQDWAEYLARIDEFMTAPPRRPPSIGIPVVGA